MSWRPTTDLGATLADMSPEEIEALRAEGIARATAKQRKEKAARSPDPIGTIRLDAEERQMWVREEGWRWNVWIEDDHGLSLADHDLPWATMPVVGTMPSSWVAERERWHREEYGDQ